MNDDTNTNDCGKPENNEHVDLKWSDKECKNIASEAFFPTVNDLSVQKRIITRFLDFYLGGRRQKGLGVDDIVFAVLAIMPRSPYDESIVWSPGQFRDDGTLFHLSPEDKVAAEVRRIIVHETKEEKEEIKNEETETEPPTSAPDTEQLEVDSVICYDHPNPILDLLGLNQQELDELMQRNESIFNIFQNKKADIAKHSHSSVWEDIQFDAKPMKLDDTVIEYGPVENSAFIRYCESLLGRWESGSARALLRALMALLALVLLRAVTKSYKHLATTFNSARFLRFLRHFQKLSPGIAYAPPHKRCLKGAFRTFSRRDKNTSIMFAKLILLSDRVTDKYLKYLLKNGLLNYTADYGLNLVMMWHSICTEVTVDDVKRIVKVTTRDETRASWEKLTQFFDEYKRASCRETSYRWARILDSRYFKEVSCQANYPLAVVLAVFAERIVGNTGVWGASWTKNDDEEQGLKELGERLFQQYESRVDECESINVDDL